MTEIAQSSINRVSLTQIIELAIQKTYHDLTVLAELLPRKRDFERKVEIVNFAERTRQLFIRLLALVRWAGSASKIEQCMDIVTFLDKQALLFINTADNMANIARNTLVQARLPSFQLPCAVEVLTLGTYSRMPTCVRDRIIPPDPISLKDKRATLARLDHIIEQRLSRSKIHPSMRNLKIEFGRVTFHVENEFDLKLTVLGDGPNLPWCVLSLDLLVEDVDTGEGKDLVHPAHLKLIERMIQQKMNESSTPLVDVFAKLHNFCLSLQIEVLHDQIERLMRERLASFIKIKEHIPGQELALTYWGCKNVLKIQTDQSDSSKPLRLVHQPELILEGGYVDSNKDNIFRPGNVSVEQLITDTIQKRAYVKLNQLANELRDKKYGRCTISGVPCLLHVCCLDPCAPSEELIISIDLNGSYLAHVPQYEKSCPLADHIQESLNSNRSKLGTYFDQLKIWLTKKRCIRTIDYLSVTATESLPLCSKANHAKLDDKLPRLFFQFNKYNHYYLMAEMFTSDAQPFAVHIRYSLLVTEPAPSITGDGLDIVETDTSVETVKRDLVIVENILRLDVQAIISSNYCYESIAQEKSLAFSNAGVTKRENKKFRGDFIDDPTSNDICHHSGTRPPVALVNELPQIVSFCEEKLAHLALEKELRNRNLNYEVSHSETSGYAYCISFSSLPNLRSNGHSNALRKDTSVMAICLHEKPQSSKIWHCSYIFKNCPITTQSSKEQSPRRFVFTPYESPLLNPTMVSKFIDDTQLDWACMAHLYDVVKEFSRDIQNDPTILDKIVLKTFNYKKLVILYGPMRNFSVSLLWKPADRKFLLIFSVVGGSPFTLNPHSCMATHYKHEFNQHKSIKALVISLNATLQPLAILQSFPVYPFLGLHSGRPAVPVTSSCLIPLSTTRAKLIYRNWHSIDIRIQSGGLVVVRDGSFSRFDRDKTAEELNPICNFESLVFRSETASSYLLNMNEFRNMFQVSHLEKHLGMSFMFKNILEKLSRPVWFPTARALSPRGDSSIISYASDLMQFRFSIDKTRGLQMKVAPIVMDEWRPDEIEVLEKYFETRVGSYPFKSDPFMSFCRLLFNYPKNVVRDFISIFKLELCWDHMDPNIHWNVALCPLVTAGTPFIGAGYSSICPLKAVTLFVLQFTRRVNYSPAAPSIYVPVTYDTTLNNLTVYIPPRSEATIANQLPHLIGFEGHLKQFCDQFRASGNSACIIYPAIRHLITIPNLLVTYRSDQISQ